MCGSHKNLQTFGPKLLVSGWRCFQVAYINLENCKYLNLLLELKQGQRCWEASSHRTPGIVQIPVHKHPGPRASRSVLAMWTYTVWAGKVQLLGESLSLVCMVCALAVIGWMEKALFQSVAVGVLLFFMHKMGCLLPKQTLAVCLWVLCHQQLRSWGGFTAMWCQTTNPDCHADVVIRNLCFCLWMVPQNSDNYTEHHLTSLPVCSTFIYTYFHSQSAEPRL